MARVPGRKRCGRIRPGVDDLCVRLGGDAREPVSGGARRLALDSDEGGLRDGTDLREMRRLRSPPTEAVVDGRGVRGVRGVRGGMMVT